MRIKKDNQDITKFIYLIKYQGPKASAYSIVAIADSVKSLRRYILKHRRKAAKFYRSINSTFEWDSDKNSNFELTEGLENYEVKNTFSKSYIPNKLYILKYAYKRITSSNCYSYGSVSYLIYRFENDGDGIIEF